MITKNYNLQNGEVVKDFLLSFKSQPLMWLFFFGVFSGCSLLFYLDSQILKAVDYAYILVNAILLVMFGME